MVMISLHSNRKLTKTLRMKLSHLLKGKLLFHLYRFEFLPNVLHVFSPGIGSSLFLQNDLLYFCLLVLLLLFIREVENRALYLAGKWSTTEVYSHSQVFLSIRKQFSSALRALFGHLH